MRRGGDWLAAGFAKAVGRGMEVSLRDQVHLNTRAKGKEEWIEFTLEWGEMRMRLRARCLALGV